MVSAVKDKENQDAEIKAFQSLQSVPVALKIAPRGPIASSTCATSVISH
jgi:hypothetical protein